jgi:hypothetical protein
VKRSNKKETQKYSDWHEKYFVHGMLSDIIADVSGQIHGCFDSSISNDVDAYFTILNEINTLAAKVLNDRRLKISTVEKSLNERFIHERDELIKILLRDGCSYANQYEAQYRKFIEEFIKTLEIEMSKHLDYLQKEIEADRQSIFKTVNVNINRITQEADRARSDFHRLLQEAAARKRKEIMEIIEVISADTTAQTLGYEQLRKVQLDIYSTVGTKEADSCCKNIPDREKFIKDINAAKSHQPTTKRTVYLDSSFTTQQTHTTDP